MLNNKNRGMFLESVINKTISWLWQNNIAFIEKKSLSIVFKGVEKDYKKSRLLDAKVTRKSTVDYIGCYNGKFICFEAKSVNIDRFSLDNIKKHQFEYLKSIHLNGGISFLILFFSHYNEFYFVDINYLDYIYNNSNIKSINYQEIKNNSRELTLEFPGILNILSF
ncbi:Holliday junction resolvase RecU [Mycoplasma sp. CSL10137]|uniref:Holliday junction resolvase RecU n=2 Tax=Mycoplasma TaxID=2093 RepID=UPI00197C2CA6|nr:MULTISPECIES: Holliday junction resolvase RecU [unclassified Mycoplasma]MBN4083549.1 Holliday junction resolvase RecU [Mycoplasma sp. CSL10137]MBN4084520.1 Holliday junction resolvase RecU [Mycoplasma sp. CSL10166]MBU4692999.1 Holliday junction resolvase RecU [Mycoplasma sp. CSL7491-lung]